MVSRNTTGRKPFPMHPIPLIDDSVIERKATPGPGPLNSNIISVKKAKNVDEDADTASIIRPVESDTEAISKQLSFALKKAPKEINVIHDGRINIITQLDGPRDGLCVKYNEDCDFIAVGYNDGVIRVYNSTTGKLVFQLTDPEVNNKRSPVTSIKHRPISKMYPVTNCFTGTYANGFVKCWSYHFSQCLYTIRERRQTLGLAYHPRVPKFVTYGDDGKICFYDEETGTKERVLMSSDDPTRHDGHMSRIFAACFHPRNNYELITGGWDDVVHFWDLRQPHAIRHLSGIHMCGEGIDINPRGTEVLTCAFQTVDPLQMFDYGSGKRMSCIEPDIHSSRLYCGKFATKDFIVAGGTDQNLFRVIDLQTITTVANVNGLPGGVYSLDLGPSKKKPEKPKDHSGRPKSDISLVPKVAFVSSKKLYQVDFY